MGVCVIPLNFVKKQKIWAKVDGNSGKIWFGKVGQNPFLLIVFI